jgi:DNA polymerase III alpha subunit (gram-positive type)
MTHREELWNKAEQRLYELYGDYPDLRIKNRFFEEKKALSHLGVAEYFDQLGEICIKSLDEYNEKLPIKSTISSCFTAYLLAADGDVNPLPTYYYCEECGTLIWADKGSCLLDMKPRKCECGAGKMKVDGFDLCYEVYLPYGEMLQKKGPMPGNYKELFSTLTKKFFQINLIGVAQTCNLLGDATEIYPHKIDLSDEEVKKRLLSGEFDCFNPKMAEFLQKAYSVVKPQNYNELLKIISLSKGTNTWNQTEILLRDGVCMLSEIPSSRDEVLSQIRDAMIECGFYDSGFAYDVMNKVRNGYYSKHGGIDNFTAKKLYMLGFDKWFVDYLSHVVYMAPKALSVAELRYSIALKWYKTYHPKQYAEVVIGEENIWEGDT